MTEQTVGWALHALEPDEEIAALEHLETCDECQRLAADVADVTGGLAEAVEQHQPPPRLRASIVEQAQRTPQVAPPPSSKPVDEPEDRIAPVRTEPPTGSRHRTADRPAFRPGRRILAAAAALAILVGGGGLVAYAQQMRAERDASIAQSREMFDMVAQMSRPGTQHAFLAESPGAQPVAAVMVHDDTSSVMAVGLSPNSVDDQTYVLWGLNDGVAPKAIGTFDVRPSPDQAMSVGSATGGTFSQYAISLERGRVAPASPSSVIASGQVET